MHKIQFIRYTFWYTTLIIYGKVKFTVLYRQRTIHSTRIIQSDNSSHSHVHVQTGKAKNNQVTLKKLQKLTYTQKFVQDKAQFNGTNPFTWTNKRRILIANLYKWLLYFPDKFNLFVRFNFTKLIWLQGPSLLSYDILLINKVQHQVTKLIEIKLQKQWVLKSSKVWWEHYLNRFRKKNLKLHILSIDFCVPMWRNIYGCVVLESKPWDDSLKRTVSTTPSLTMIRYAIQY